MSIVHCQQHKHAGQFTRNGCVDCRAHMKVEELYEMREKHRQQWIQVFKLAGFTDPEFDPDATTEALFAKMRETAQQSTTLLDEANRAKADAEYARKILRIAERDYLNRIQVLETKIADLQHIK